jgi:hypothetical protein
VIAPALSSSAAGGGGDSGRATPTGADGGVRRDPGGGSETTTGYTAEQVRRKVWQLVFEAQTRLSQGYAGGPEHCMGGTRLTRRRAWDGGSYTSMLMQADDFVFSYTLWFEDADGTMYADALGPGRVRPALTGRGRALVWRWNERCRCQRSRSVAATTGAHA